MNIFPNGIYEQPKEKSDILVEYDLDFFFFQTRPFFCSQYCIIGIIITLPIASFTSHFRLFSFTNFRFSSASSHLGQDSSDTPVLRQATTERLTRGIKLGPSQRGEEAASPGVSPAAAILYDSVPTRN